MHVTYTWQGLEPRLGEHAPSKIQQGRSGIASGFEGEGVNVAEKGLNAEGPSAEGAD